MSNRQYAGRACPSSPSLLDRRSRGPGSWTQDVSLVMTSLPSGLLRKPLLETHSIFNQACYEIQKCRRKQRVELRLWPQEETVQ